MMIVQTSEKLRSIVESITELERYAGILVDEENRRLALGQSVCCIHIYIVLRPILKKSEFQIERLMPDGLQNQIDNIDAVVISLSTKVAVMDKMSSEQVELRDV